MTTEDIVRNLIKENKKSKKKKKNNVISSNDIAPVKPQTSNLDAIGSVTGKILGVNPMSEKNLVASGSLNFYEPQEEKKKIYRARSRTNRYTPARNATSMAESGGILSEDTRKALKETGTAAINKMTNADKFKDIWQDGYDFGDVFKTLKTVKNTINPVDRVKTKVADKTQEVVKDIKEGKTSDYIKNSKSIQDIKKTWQDGYDFGDITKTKLNIAKTILGTGTDVVANLAKGELQTAEGLVDTGRYIIGDVANAAGAETYAKNVKKRAIQNTTGFIFGENDLYNNPKEDGWLKKVDEYSLFGNTIDQINQSVGQQLFRAGLSQGINGALGKAGVATNTVDKTTQALNQLEIFAGAYGSAKSEAYMNGADDSTANKRALISATAETISENVFDNLPGFRTGGIKGSSLKNILAKATEKTFGKGTGKIIIRGLNGISEGVEEGISNALETAFTDIVNYLDPKYNYGMKANEGLDKDSFGENLQKLIIDTLGSGFSKESGEAFLTAALSTLITGAFTSGMTNVERNQVINQWAKENNVSKEKATKLFDGIRDLRLKQIVDSTTDYEQRMEMQEQLTKQLAQEIKESKKSGQKLDLQELFDTTPKTRKESKFVFTDDEIKNFDKRLATEIATSNINNEQDVHDMVRKINTAQKINKTVQYHPVTTEGLYQLGFIDKDSKGNYTLNGEKYIPRGLTRFGNEIYVNLDVGTKSATQAMFHEMFESFKANSSKQYNQFKKMVTDIVGQDNINKEINNYIEMYKKAYGDKWQNMDQNKIIQEATDEIINDKFGELAESQDFINRIANNRSVLERLIDSVKNMIKYVKGTPEEKEFIKLQNKLEKEFAKRYKETDFSKSEGETAYSLNKDNYTKEELDNINKLIPRYSGFGKEQLEEEFDIANQNYQLMIQNSNRLQKEYKELQQTQEWLDALHNYDFDSEAWKKGDELANNIRFYNKEQAKYFAQREAINEVMQNEITEYRTPETNAKEAEKHFGITNNFKETAYITINGNQLDFSGYHEGGTKGSRSLDHRQINEIDTDMDTFILQGNIRVLPESNGINLEIEPNAKQYDKLRDYIEYAKNNNNGDIYVDVVQPGSYGYNSINYKSNTPTSKIINDIKAYFKDGTFPKQSELSQFRYSLTSNKDSQGRNLTPQQQEYFKDSKVVDRDGNLMVMYHGTESNVGLPENEKFTIFDRDRAGSHGTYYGAGFYFTPNMETAQDYAKSKGDVYETYLNMTNPYIPSADTINEDGSVTFAPAFYEDFENRFKEQLPQYWNDEKTNKGRVVRNILQDNGYDGIINGDTYVVFEPNQIKNIDNTNPTSNEDIRYSLTTNKDSNGRTLSEGQQNFFKNSKVVDEDGNLQIVYHGTNKYGFTKFENEDNVFYFTDDAKQAETYYDNTKGNKYETYLNITNPYIFDAEGRNWNNLIIGNDNNIEEMYNSLTEKEKDYLSNLADKTDNLYEDYKEGLENFYQRLNATNEKLYDKVANDSNIREKLYQTALYGWADTYVEDLIGERYTTDKIVDMVLEENKNGANYDGVIFKNIVDEGVYAKKVSGKTTTDYVVFNSNQIKNVDNLNPTENDDIRLSLTSNENIDSKEIAPIGSTVEETIAPIREDISNLSNQLNNLSNQIQTLQNGGEMASNEDIAPTRLSKNLQKYYELKKQFDNSNNNQERDNLLKQINNMEDNILTDAEMREVFRNESMNLNTNNINDNIIREEENIAPYNPYRERAIQQREANQAIDEMQKDENYWKSLEQIANEEGMSALDDKSARKLARNIGKELGLKQKQVKDLQNVINDAFNNGYSLEQIKEELYNKFGHQSVTETLGEVIEAQRELRDVKIKVSPEIQKDIADYGYWKQQYFGKIRFSNEGLPVDVAYAELSDRNPAMFPKDIINPTDQLLRIAEVADMSKKYSVDYEMNPETINEAANYINDTIQETLYANAMKQQTDLEQAAMQYNERTQDIPIKKKTRQEVRENLQNTMGITTDDLQAGNDIKSFSYQTTTPERVNEKVFGREVGRKINEQTVYFAKHQEAERIRFLNKERQEIKDLGIKARSKESALVQQYGEGIIGDTELAQEIKDKATQEKIKNAARVLRSKYDTYLDQINEELVEMGYDPIPKRKDYMRHFQELTDKFSQAGIPFNRQELNSENLPTDINGLTEFNVPGKNWFASAQRRTGEKTTYDAITGIDGYLEGASNLMFHTETIQRYRALEKLIRDTYGQTHGLDVFGDDISSEEAMQRVQDIQNGKLSNYAAWLKEQGNAIAGKKGAIDRGVERALGRKGYTFLNTLKKQTGSNMTGFNVRSALTNFISSTIAASKTNKLAMVKGTVATIKNMFHNDGFIDRSDFLTSRLRNDSSLSKKTWQKISNAGQIFMSGSDWFTSNVITRSKYYEGLSKGMTEQQAMKYADDFGARVMGDRSKGATAEAFNSKTLGLLTQFQLETNNQWQYMIHDTKMEFQENLAKDGGLKAGATMLFQMGQLAAYSYLFNEMFEKLTGSRAAFDIADIFKKLFGLDDDDKDKDIETRMQEAASELMDALPFTSLFGSGGRLPIGEMLTPAQTIYDAFVGNTNKYGQPVTWEEAGKEVVGSIPYYVLPTGYGQIKKTTQGLGMYANEVPGSYTDSGNLRFTADEDTGSVIKNALFGQWSGEEAKKYRESGYKTIRANDIQEMQDLNMNSSEYRKYKNDLKEAGTKNADKLNYINSLNIPISQKNIMASNVVDRPVDMSNYTTYEEFDFAYKNPGKYQTMKAIANDYESYKKYVSGIENVRNKYSQAKGYTTEQRKKKVISYVNKLDLTIPQKAMLLRQYYTSFKNYNRQIVNYVSNLDLTYNEKVEILKSLDMKVDKKGNVTWK